MKTKKPDGEPKLTPKQELFCREYMVDMNATQAAIRAGYSSKVAAQSAGQLFRNINVKNRIEELRAEKYKQVGITAEEYTDLLTKTAKASVTDFVTWGKRPRLVTVTKDGEPIYEEGSFIDFADYEEIKQSGIGVAVQSIGVDRFGNPSLRLAGKDKAIEKLGIMLGVGRLDEEIPVAKVRIEIQTDKALSRLKDLEK